MNAPSAPQPPADAHQQQAQSEASSTAPVFSPIGIGAVAAATLAGRNIQVAKTERRLPPLLRNADNWHKD